MAVQNGLTLGIHNHWWECQPVDGQYPYRIFEERLGPRIFFEPDAYWARAAGLDPAALLQELGSQAPLGTGTTDIPALVRAGDGATEWLVVELDEVAGDMVDAVAQSYRYLTENGLAHGKK